MGNKPNSQSSTQVPLATTVEHVSLPDGFSLWNLVPSFGDSPSTDFAHTPANHIIPLTIRIARSFVYTRFARLNRDSSLKVNNRLKVLTALMTHNPDNHNTLISHYFCSTSKMRQ